MWNDWWKSNICIKLLLNDQLETVGLSIDVEAQTSLGSIDINTSHSSHGHLTNNNIQREKHIEDGLCHLQSSPDLLSADSTEKV